MKQVKSYKLQTDDIITLYKTEWEKLRANYYQDFVLLKTEVDVRNRRWYKPWTWFRKIVYLKYVG